MFYNVLRRFVQPHIQSNYKNVNSFKVLLSSSSANVCKDDIKDALDIEANLFENSSLQHKPVSTRSALRKHKATPDKQRANPAKSAPAKAASLQQSSKQPTTATRIVSPLIKDSALNLEFTRLNLQDPLLSTLLTTVRSRKRRDKNRQIIIEGRRLIREALACDLYMQSLIFSDKEQLAQLSVEVGKSQRDRDTKIYKVPHHDLKTWSSLISPPGLMAIFERPSTNGLEQTLLKQQELGCLPLPITVVCDNIREPNNLGSIIRTCAALPCQQVVVTHGCCDPWESKALRGGCGGQFRLPIYDDVTWEELPYTIPPEAADSCHVFIAENNCHKLADTNAVEYAGINETGAHNLLIIGGESHGVSEEAYKFMNLVGNRGKCVYIPLAAGIDSLNVASALTLILFELKKKLQVPSA